MGHHYGGSVSFERFYVVAVAPFFDADDGVDIVEFGGADLVLDVKPVVGDVFVANPNGRDSSYSAYFDDARVGEIDFEGSGIFSGAQFPQ